IDFEKKQLKSDVASYDYDYLVLGTGGHPEFFGIPGIQQHSFTLWSLEDAIRIREHVELMFRAAAKEPHADKRKRQLTFVVAGAGFTGIELVGELMERADSLCRTYHIDRKEVNIMVVEAQAHILPILSEKPQRKARAYMEKRGVKILLNAPIIKGEHAKYFLKDGSVIEAETLVWTCGVQGSEFTSKISLTKGRVSNDKCSVASPEGIHGLAACYFEEDEKAIVGERGRILVNEKMQSVDYENVFLVGDMMWYVHEEKVMPQIVENALQSAETAAHNIIAMMEKSEAKPYKPAFHGFMISIGGRYAVASVMGMNLYGFFAMAVKHMINLHYLWGLAGFNACWAYVWEEFLDIKNKRSLIHGHGAAKIPAFFALPARLWLGLIWVMEGVNKIGEGWLNFDKSRSTWMFSKGVVQAGGKPAAASGITLITEGAAAVADAATSASDAAWDTGAAVAESAGEAIIIVGGEAAKTFGKIWDLDKSIFAWDSPLVTWFRETFMDGMAAQLHFGFFQVMIVAVEVLLGLAIMGGLFTFPAAGVSIIMCIVFTLSGMFTWNQLWFVFLAIVMLGGAGHAFGLDHYVMPWIKDWWGGRKLAHRTFLYAGEPILKKKKR
ncbi:MAG: FAD-dependent oxidoreductase, partial [Spirochaetes bacterium]|nr:FAD-dependent oxidoreductase [Spirochaetota bacterium]